MSEIESLLRRNIDEVFGQPDAAKRREAIAELFTEDCIITAPSGLHHGRDAIDAEVVSLLERLPGFVFRDGTARIIEGAGLIEWSFGPPGEPARITGTDIIVCRDGRIHHLMVFLNL